MAGAAFLNNENNDGYTADLNLLSGYREEAEMNDTVSFHLHLADTSLILAQRNAEWCGHGPILEQDIAITNISLDLLGQARNFYQYAALLINEKGIDTKEHRNGTEVTEDTLAYFRTEREFKNLLITELPKGDWAQTILRQFLFSVYAYLLYERLQKSENAQLAAIAQKSIKEVAYHIKWSGEWVIRLGDGTIESNQKMIKALDYLWPYTGEFFLPAAYETPAVMGFDISTLRQPWLEKVNNVLKEATLWDTPIKMINNGFMHSGGKQGIHTEHMGFILAEMQYLQRTYPGAEW